MFSGQLFNIKHYRTPDLTFPTLFNYFYTVNMCNFIEWNSSNNSANFNVNRIFYKYGTARMFDNFFSKWDWNGVIRIFIPVARSYQNNRRYVVTNLQNRGACDFFRNFKSSCVTLEHVLFEWNWLCSVLVYYKNVTNMCCTCVPARVIHVFFTIYLQNLYKQNVYLTNYWHES